MTILSISLNALTGTISLETSPVRPFLFLGFLALVFLAEKQPYVSLSKRSRMRALAVSIVSLTVLFLLPVFEQALVFAHFSIPERDLAVFFTGEEITNTRLAHSHFGKVPLAAYLTGSVRSVVSAIDTGAALAPYVNPVATKVAALFFLLAFCGLLVAVAGREPLDGNARRPKIWLLLYAFTSFYVLEKSIDGGIVSDGAGLALVLLLLLPRSYAFSKRRQHAVVGMFGYLSVLLILGAIGWYWPQSYLYLALLHTVTFAAVWFALASLAFAERRTEIRAACSLAAVLVACAAGYSLYTSFSYFSTPLIQNRSMLALYPYESSQHLPESAKHLGALELYDPAELGYARVWDVTEALELPYWYYPVTAGERACDTSEPFPWNEYRFSILSKAELHSFSPNESMPLAATVAQSGNQAPPGWHRYIMQVWYPRCVGRAMNALREAFVKAGGGNAIIYDISHYQATTASMGIMENALLK